jgi:hypothetical protein
VNWKTSAISDRRGYPARTVRADRADAMAISRSAITASTPRPSAPPRWILDLFIEGIPKHPSAGLNPSR